MSTQTDITGTDPARVVSELTCKRCRTKPSEPAEDGVEYTDAGEYAGRAAIEARVTGAHEQFVATGGFVFVPAKNAVRHHNAITFTTQMIPAVGGVPVWSQALTADNPDH